MRVAAIIPAAGEGKRMHSPVKKPFLLLKGKPILAHTLDLMERQSNIEKIWVAGPQQELTDLGFFSQTYHYQKIAEIVSGGRTRQESVWNALRAVGPGWDLILVHDAVRPLCSPEAIQRVIAAAWEHKAAILAVPVKETIKFVQTPPTIDRTLEREKLIAAQTPQVFEAALLRRAFEQAVRDGFTGTDEASLVERLPHPVTVVEGSYENIKITTPEDLVLAERIMDQRPDHPEAA